MDRIQGTDGIRREVRLQDDRSLRGLSPWEAFAERGVITDALLEGYAYAFARLRLAASASREIVVAWDPRDPSGAFTGAVVRGLRKGGATAAVMGVAPTPAVPMYMMYRGAAAGLMVTASHNPAGQNGVKIFLAPAGLKLLPEDDRELTAAVRELDWEEVAEAEASGGKINSSLEWPKVFAAFHLAAGNSWLAAAEKSLADFVLVVDPARGSYSGFAMNVLRAYGAEVVEVNADAGDGRVNWRSGVADLEGVTSVSFEDVAPGGRFGDYPALAALGKLEAANGAALAAGRPFLGAVVFDADGDRFYLVVYDASGAELIVLSGDEVAVLQAEELARRLGGGGGRAFVNTVESDLAVADAAAALGYEAVLKPVGDKWILTEAWRRALELGEEAEDGASLSAALLPRFEAGDLPRPEEIAYGVGCEETGHAITFGELTTAEGKVVPHAAGNGLKSALNTLAAVATIRGELAPEELYRRLRAPFARGYKSNNYVFYTRKENLLRGGEAYAALEEALEAALSRHAPSLTRRKLHFAEEPDLLYWAGFDGGRQVLGAFCRNSGTEEKSALYLRATEAWAPAAKAVEEELYPPFYVALKDLAHARSGAEAAWLGGGPLPTEEEARRVILLEGLAGSAGLSGRGEAVREALRRAKKL